MKDYKQMAESALKRISEYEIRQKKRKKAAIQATIVAGSICVVLLVATGIFKGRILKADLGTTGMNVTTQTALNTSLKNDKTTAVEQSETRKTTTVITEENSLTQQTSKKEATKKNQIPSLKSEEATVTTHKNAEKETSLKSAGTYDVIYSDNATKGQINFAKTVEKGSVAVSDELRNAVKRYGIEKNYAVMVSFEPSISSNYISEIKVDGVSATELKKQADALLSEGKNTDAKRLLVKINEAKRVYLRKCIDDFEETFGKNGMDIYVEERGTTVENMIFYTYATGEQINNFTCKSTEAFYFTHAARFK